MTEFRTLSSEARALDEMRDDHNDPAFKQLASELSRRAYRIGYVLVQREDGMYLRGAPAGSFAHHLAKQRTTP